MNCNCKNLTYKEIKRRNILFVGAVMLILGIAIWGGLRLSNPYEPSKIALQLAVVMDNAIKDKEVDIMAGGGLFFENNDIQIFYQPHPKYAILKVKVEWHDFDIAEEAEGFLRRKAKAYYETLKEQVYDKERARRDIILKVKPIGEKL